MSTSTTKEPKPTSTTDTPTEESPPVNTAVEEIRKEFSQNNQHNLPRDKREGETLPRRPFRGAKNKKDYQRSRGRNKR
ncbi:MAG TPA: hypothetical protein VE955_00180 [Candidatus Dormibacteraeota bacterium]|jgi:hypothetical protein|nr:hypothetical protein [Candidatus Dormibacteraeota bacterium]